MGGVIYSPHPRFQQGTLVIEDRNSPITKGLPAKMVISDEWYEFNESPRPRVHVIATADESTYKPNKPMGDHPMIWTNEKYPRTVYIAIGHDASLCVNPDYQVLVAQCDFVGGGAARLGAGLKPALPSAWQEFTPAFELGGDPFGIGFLDNLFANRKF